MANSEGKLKVRFEESVKESNKEGPTIYFKETTGKLASSYKTECQVVIKRRLQDVSGVLGTSQSSKYRKLSL